MCSYTPLKGQQECQWVIIWAVSSAAEDRDPVSQARKRRWLAQDVRPESCRFNPCADWALSPWEEESQVSPA